MIRALRYDTKKGQRFFSVLLLFLPLNFNNDGLACERVDGDARNV